MKTYVVQLEMLKKDTLERYEHTIEVQASYEDAAFVEAFTQVRLDPVMRQDFLLIKEVREKFPSP